jgi:hypothetical protein
VQHDCFPLRKASRLSSIASFARRARSSFFSFSSPHSVTCLISSSSTLCCSAVSSSRLFSILSSSASHFLRFSKHSLFCGRFPCHSTAQNHREVDESTKHAMVTTKTKHASLHMKTDNYLTNDSHH